MTQPFHQTHFFIDRPFVVMKGNEIVGHYKNSRTASKEAERSGGEVITPREAQHRVAINQTLVQAAEEFSS